MKETFNMVTDEESLMEFSNNSGHFSKIDKEDKYQTEDSKSNSDTTGDFIEFNQDEEKDLFHDANYQIIRTDLKTSSLSDNNFQIIDVYEERLNLPHLRPPNLKVGIFTILKDVIGKDLSKVSLPVYFNEPMSITQKTCEVNEYCELLDRAAQEPNSLFRLALIASFNVSRFNTIKDRTLKPFNSLLGETYELVTSKFRHFSEQVSHHPPITAFHIQSSHFELYSS